MAGMQHLRAPHPRPAVGAVVFKDEKVLLVRRANPPSKGKWAIPGGKIRWGETLQEAAQREVLEETGITIRAGRPVYTFDSIVRDPTGKVVFHYVIVDLEAEYVSGRPAAGDDADQVAWVGRHEIQGLDVSWPTRRLLHSRYGWPARAPGG